MRRLLTVAWLLLSAAVAFGQSIEGGGGSAVTPPVFVPASVSYSGPGDVVSGAIAFYSCYRAYNNAYATGSNKSCNLVRASDSHACDILIATNGFWGNTTACGTGGDNGQTAASFCNATTCSVAEAYDQTGTGNHVVQATAATQPTITFSCFNSNPCMVSSGSQHLASAGAVTQSQPFTITFTASRTANFTNYGDVVGTGDNNVQALFNNVANQGFMFTGSFATFASFNDSVTHNAQFVYSTTSSIAYFDGGNSGTLSPGSNGFGATIHLFDGNNQLTGDIAEAGVWPSAFNGTQAGNVCHNQYLVWSGSSAC